MEVVSDSGIDIGSAVGGIVGGAVGVAILLVSLCALLIWFRRRKHKDNISKEYVLNNELYTVSGNSTLQCVLGCCMWKVNPLLYRCMH